MNPTTEFAKFSNEICIHGRPDDVFDTLTDVRTWSGFNPEAITAAIVGKEEVPCVGSKLVIKIGILVTPPANITLPPAYQTVVSNWCVTALQRPSKRSAGIFRYEGKSVDGTLFDLLAGLAEPAPAIGESLKKIHLTVTYCVSYAGCGTTIVRMEQTGTITATTPEDIVAFDIYKAGQIRLKKDNETFLELCKERVEGGNFCERKGKSKYCGPCAPVCGPCAPVCGPCAPVSGLCAPCGPCGPARGSCDPCGPVCKPRCKPKHRKRRSSHSSDDSCDFNY